MGDPHYTTFDGHKHDFQGGDCRFTLIETSDFEVVGTNVHRDGKKEVSWNDAVDIFFGGLNLFLGAGNEVQVDGEDVFLPYNKIIRGRRVDKSISVIQAGESVSITSTGCMFISLKQFQQVRYDPLISANREI